LWMIVDGLDELDGLDGQKECPLNRAILFYSFKNKNKQIIVVALLLLSIMI